MGRNTALSVMFLIVMGGRTAVIAVQQMFGDKRKDAIRQRANLMGRMVMLLTDGLCTKSYDQFVERYSNPGDGPDEIARNARISRFEMRFSPTCWYEATASLAENAQPWILIEGGGDDCGVFISVQIPGRCQRAFPSRRRFAGAAGCEKRPRRRRNGAGIARHTRLASGHRDLSRLAGRYPRALSPRGL